jgi:hypothetical protein
MRPRKSGSQWTHRWREPDSNPRSHPTALVAAHIPPIIDATSRRSSAAALADGFVPLESDRRHSRIRLHRSRTLVISVPFRLKRPASTSGTRSSNPLSSSGESDVLRGTAEQFQDSVKEQADRWSAPVAVLVMFVEGVHGRLLIRAGEHNPPSDQPVRAEMGGISRARPLAS